MFRNLVPYLAAVCITSGSIDPVWADDSQTGAASSKTTSQSSSKGIGRIASFPIKVIGCAVGAVVGMPIAAVRKSKEEELDGVHYMCGDTEQKVILVPVSAFWLPLAISTGVMESLIYGPMDSVKHFNEPFSKDQFSLGDMK